MTTAPCSRSSPASSTWTRTPTRPSKFSGPAAPSALSRQQLQTIVIAGASLAGLRAAETLRQEGFDGRVVLIGAEKHLPYDRPPLSKQLLAGACTVEQINLR